MSLMGRYTTYVGGAATAAHTLLSKLYPNSPFAQQLANGDEVKAQAAVKATATAPVVAGVGGLLPSDGKQAGNLGMFPQGVDLSFGAAPDVSTVKWTRPGDPAGPHVPDVTSPSAGPGHIAGTDKTADPSSTVPALQAVATTEDPAGQDLRNPSADSPAVYKNNAIGQPQVMGDSGGNV